MMAKWGKARRGNVIMDIIETFTDFGAPEFNVTGVASVERISQGQVRITKYSHRRDGNIVVFHEVWDIEAYTKAACMVKKLMMEVISHEPAPVEDGSANGQARH